MSASRYKHQPKKKLRSELCMSIRSLRKENGFLLKALTHLVYHLAEHKKLVEKLLCLETQRFESGQQLNPNHESDVSPLEDLCKNEGPSEKSESVNRESPKSTSTRDDSLEVASTGCQDLKINHTGKQVLTSDSHSSSNDKDVSDVHNQLKALKVLEKNKQLLESDQQSEACVKAVLTKPLWREKVPNEANQNFSEQHEDDPDDERLRVVQDFYERLLKKAEEEVHILREEVAVVHQGRINAQNRLKVREDWVEELLCQSQSESLSKESLEKDQKSSEEEELSLCDDSDDSQVRLTEEQRKPANIELQRYILNNFHADQKKIAELKRQIKIFEQDYEDTKQDCSYLKTQMIKILKKLSELELQTNKQANFSYEVNEVDFLSPKDDLAPSYHNSLLDESFLECPTCQALYPASQYRKLLTHLDVCFK